MVTLFRGFVKGESGRTKSFGGFLYKVFKNFYKLIDNMVLCDRIKLIIIVAGVERMIGGMRVGALIPAAGMSSRMGRFKPLLPFWGETVIERSAATALELADTAVAVLGKRAEELAELLLGRFGERLTLAYNRDFAQTDMLASVKLGLRALGECGCFFLVPADMPLIAPATYEALLAAYDGAHILIPSVNGRRGHPPLIPARAIPDILAYEGEGGLRAVFERVGVREIPVPDEGAVLDLDTWEDYERARRL